MKLLVISNCQVQPLVTLLGGLSAFESVNGLPIHLMNTAHFTQPKKTFDDVLAADPRTTIISIPLGPEWGDLATSVLRQNYPNVLTINNLYFSGLHPDITYLAERNKRVASPLGEYHSKLILYAYLSGLSPTQCLALFSEVTFERAGYFDDFDKSSNKLLAKEHDVDIKFADHFLSQVREMPMLFTFNHPTAFCTYHWVKHIASYFDVPYPNDWFGFEENHLSSNVWWPIYPAIAAYHRCHFSGSLLFRSERQMGGRFLNLPEFVERSYTIYSEHRNAVGQSPQALRVLKEFSSILGQ